MSRNLRLATDRDRIAAARYAAEKLRDRLNTLALRHKLVWISYVDSAGGVRSESV
jgi:hypothetical protein